jgi:hypothetical protein
VKACRGESKRQGKVQNGGARRGFGGSLPPEIDRDPAGSGIGQLAACARKIGGYPAAGEPLARPGWSAGGLEKAGGAHSDEATGARDQNLGAWLGIRHAFCLCVAVFFTPSRSCMRGRPRRPVLSETNVARCKRKSLSPSVTFVLVCEVALAQWLRRRDLRRGGARGLLVEGSSLR